MNTEPCQPFIPKFKSWIFLLSLGFGLLWLEWRFFGIICFALLFNISMLHLTGRKVENGEPIPGEKSGATFAIVLYCICMLIVFMFMIPR